MRLIGLVLFVATLTYGWASIAESPGSRQNPQALAKSPANVTAARQSDPELLAARRQAIKTLPRFRELAGQLPDALAMVKFPLTDNGVTEHIWLQVVKETDQNFEGRLGNVPVNLRNFNSGDALSVPKSEIEDWMVSSHGKLYGGYSTRVLAARSQDPRTRAIAKMLQD